MQCNRGTGRYPVERSVLIMFVWLAERLSSLLTERLVRRPLKYGFKAVGQLILSYLTIISQCLLASLATYRIQQ